MNFYFIKERDFLYIISRFIFTVLGAVVSIIVYSMDYFPLLVALADKTSVGDLLGTLYIWTMTSLYIIQRLGCYGDEVNPLFTDSFRQMLMLSVCTMYSFFKLQGVRGLKMRRGRFLMFSRAINRHIYASKTLYDRIKNKEEKNSY